MFVDGKTNKTNTECPNQLVFVRGGDADLVGPDGMESCIMGPRSKMGPRSGPQRPDEKQDVMWLKLSSKRL